MGTGKVDGSKAAKPNLREMMEKATSSDKAEGKKKTEKKRETEASRDAKDVSAPPKPKG